MKRLILFISATILLILAALTFPPAAASPAHLEVHLVGGLPLPFLFHFVGGSIANIGNTTASNVTFIMTLRGGILGTTNETLEGFQQEIRANQAYAVGIHDAYGFGVVTVTLTASASNAANVTTTVHGIQIGGFTWIPFSWMQLVR